MFKKNDLIDIVSPGSRCSDAELENGVRVIESMGFKVRVPKNIFAEFQPQQGELCSQKDFVRAQHLLKAFEAKDSVAVWAARGGYGSLRIIPTLLKGLKKKKTSKLFLGYSDTTTIHQAIHLCSSSASLHSPMLDRLGRVFSHPSPYYQKEFNELKSLLLGETTSQVFEDLIPMNPMAQKTKSLQGVLQGGNLTVLTSSLGTPLFKKMKNFLFLEDRGERGYKIDRMLTQLSQAGAFDAVKAVFLGDFTEGNESNGQNFVWPVLEKWAQSIKIPVFRGLPVGHGEYNRPLFLNSKSVVKKKNDSSWSLEIQVPNQKSLTVKARA